MHTLVTAYFYTLTLRSSNSYDDRHLPTQQFNANLHITRKMKRGALGKG